MTHGRTPEDMAETTSDMANQTLLYPYLASDWLWDVFVDFGTLQKCQNHTFLAFGVKNF